MKYINIPTLFDELGEIAEYVPQALADMFGPVALCDRSAAKMGKSAGKTAANVGAQEGASANQIASGLIPGLESEATNPTGFTPTEMNNELVAGEQGAGGANSGITGQANLTAGRTRNAGGYGAALDEAARIKGRQLSQNSLNVQNESDKLAQEKQKNAQGALAGLYGTDTKAMLDAMGLVPSDVNAAANADKTGWVQDVTDLGNMLSGGYKAYKSS